MSAAADAEDKTEKSPVTPGPLAPARELYGYMLLDRGMPKEALAAFEATMAKEPNRFNAYVGAAKAAQALGDKAKAKANYEKLVALAARVITTARHWPRRRRSSQAIRRKVQPIAAGDAMKRTAVIAAVVAFGLGGLVGAFAFLALLLPERSRAVATTKPSGLG